MKRKSTLLGLVIALTLVSIACSKSGTAANMSDDDKYKLFYAATKTGDAATITQAGKAIGLVNADGTPTDYYKKFIDSAPAMAQKNVAFLQEINTPEKAKEYVKSHMP